MASKQLLIQTLPPIPGEDASQIHGEEPALRAQPQQQALGMDPGTHRSPGG